MNTIYWYIESSCGTSGSLHLFNQEKNWLDHMMEPEATIFKRDKRTFPSNVNLNRMVIQSNLIQSTSIPIFEIIIHYTKP